jgi:hypothetical protein
MTTKRDSDRYPGRSWHRNHQEVVMKRLRVLIVIVGLMSGCATVNKDMASWVGHHYSELFDKWSPPTCTSPDGRGGQILIYEYDRKFGQIPGHAERNVDGSVTYIAPTQMGYVATRMFWVDASGLIYNWRWQGM